MEKIKLFCFPYAGGSAMMYRRWTQLLPSFISLHAFELAGRGSRIHDPFYDTLEEAVADVFQSIKSDIDEGPYAFFGHSMGALIAHELTQKTRESNFPAPMELFVSGRGALSFQRGNSKSFRTMDDEAFKLELKQMGGTPDEFFEHPELMEFFIPLLKSDFELAMIDLSDREIKPVPCPITVLIGKQDNITEREYLDWKKFTTGQFKMHYFEGDHFFINDQTPAIVNTIAQHLASSFTLKYMV